MEVEDYLVSLEEVAVERSEKRVQSLMDILNSNKDKPKMSVLLEQQSYDILVEIYSSMFTWRQWRKTIMTRFLQMKFIDLLVEASFAMVEPGWKSGEEDVTEKRCLEVVNGIICTGTDRSDEVCLFLIARGDYLELVVKTLADPNYEASDIFLSIAIIFNISKLPESRQQFESANAVEKLKHFLTLDNEQNQISALCAIAFLMSDSKDSTLLIDENSIIPKLLEFLRRAVEYSYSESEHTYSGFSAEELVQSLAILAVNDENKAKIAECGAVRLLVLLLSSKNSTEHSRAIDCLWALAFKDEIRKEILATEGFTIHLKNIADTSTDSDLKVKAKQAFDFITIGPDSLVRSTSVTSPNVAPIPGDDNDHIFISYNWKHQDIVLKIRQFLVDKGFKVWMDVDKMTNNTLEAMASGVEQAKLVLICYSEHYKQSNMCRTEAEYVFRLGKPFIPINMEYRYFPTGWLGIIIGARLYVDFSLHKHPLNIVFGRLNNEITTIFKISVENDSCSTALALEKSSHDRIQTFAPKQSEAGKFDGPTLYLCPCCNTEMLVLPYGNSMKSEKTQVEQTGEEIKLWSTRIVSDWLQSEGFENGTLEGFTGSDLFQLFDMKKSAPECFFNSLLAAVGNNLRQTIRLSAAIEKCFENYQPADQF